MMMGDEEAGTGINALSRFSEQETYLEGLTMTPLLQLLTACRP